MVLCKNFLSHDFSFTRFCDNSSSFIDHFIVSCDFANMNMCTNLRVFDDHTLGELNMSDHCAIAITLTIPAVYNMPNKCDSTNIHLLWCNASAGQIAEYQACLTEEVECLLHNFPMVLHDCPGCLSSEHTNLIDSLCSQLHVMLLNCGRACIPHNRPTASKPAVAGWNTECAPERAESLKWHHIWVQAGRPTTGVLANIMRATRKRYHETTKRILSSQNEQRNTQVVNSCENSSPFSFWKEVHRANARKAHAYSSSNINGCNNNTDIANGFKTMYEQFFRAGFTSSNDLNVFHSSLNNDCVNVKWQKFTVEEVTAACMQLKHDKKDADVKLNSSAIINAPAVIFKLLCLLINAIVLHGHVPPQWLTGTILPLLKSGNVDKSSFLSYRPITLSSLFGKIIDILILNRHVNVFNSCDLQFGFKHGHSTNHCTFVAREVIDYYRNNGSDVFACTLDMQKAFDRVNLIKLFNRPALRQLPVHIVRILFLLYSQLSLCVLWNGCISDSFMSLNGLKQGGILSPFLFSVYMNDLLSGLEKLKVGCFVGHVYFGCLAYADDIILLAPTLAALRIMLTFCSLFAEVNDILFNPTKSHCIKFCNNMSVVQYDVVLQGSSLKWVDRVVHLGHVLVMTNDDVSDIRRCCDSFCKQVNLFCARFGHLPVIIRRKLFQSFCLSFYGSQLWDLNHKELQFFDTACRKAIRRVCNLPFMTHSAILPFFMDGNDFHMLPEMFASL